jgi:hypothetical protein
MKRTTFKKPTLEQVKAKQALKRPKQALKRTLLAKLGKSSNSVLKREIQALLRQIVIKRDGGCVLNKYLGNCNQILQAEHLVSRARTNYFGDTRNIVCLCSYHHIFWKPQFSRLYWELIEKHLGPEKWEWYRRAEADNKAYKVDLKLVKLALEQEYKTLDK